MEIDYNQIFIFFCLLLVIGIGCDWLASVKSNSNDSGEFWFNNLIVFASLAIFFSLLYVIDQSFPQLDIRQQITSNLPFFSNEVTWKDLWIPLIIKVIIGIAFLFIPMQDMFGWKRALVGTISSNLKRTWLLYATLFWAFVLLIPYFLSMVNYPLLLYSIYIIVLVDLLFLSLSSAKSTTLTKVEGEKENSPLTRKDWCQTIKECVDIEHILSIKRHEPEKIEEKDNASNIDNKLLRQGVAIELIEAVKELTASSMDNDQLNKLVIAPDYCGQLEILALAAETIYLRYYTVSLIVVPEHQKQDVMEQIKPHLKIPNSVFECSQKNPLPDHSNYIIWITDPKTLSDALINSLTANDVRIKQVGLISWFDIHHYTGILAGNLWAIAHRLHRLVKIRGRQDIRSLTFIRRSQYSAGSPLAFAQKLLPIIFSEKCIVNISEPQKRTVYVYQLKGISKDPIPLPPENQQHSFLYAIRGSIISGRSTFINDYGKLLTSGDKEDFLKRHENIIGQTKKLNSYVKDSPAFAEAEILGISEHNVLMLPELITASGRGTSLSDHYIGLFCSGNPYISYLLDYFKVHKLMPSSQHLIAPKPSPAVVERHLSKALTETASTRSEIETDFQFEEIAINKTLANLNSRAQELIVDEIRYLDNTTGELKVEPQYRCHENTSREIAQPLDTVGKTLIKIIDTARGEHQSGIQSQVDPERILICAYPGRIFYHDGRRYKIIERDWDNWEETKAIYCEPELKNLNSWRITKPKLENCQQITPPAYVQAGDKGNINYFLVKLKYQEIFNGVYITSASDFNPNNPYTISFDPRFSNEFDTEALMIEFPFVFDDGGIEAISEALKYIVPVHLGINIDTLEIIALHDLEISGNSYSGILIVELYPSGIGLVKTIDRNLIHNFLEWVAKWLNYCQCDNDGCPKCILYLEKTFNYKNISKQSALNILDQVFLT